MVFLIGCDGIVKEIEFRNYAEDLLDAHIELVKEVDYPALYYPDKKELKELYSGDNFTPETRYYAFFKGELIGFIPSAVEEKVDDIQYGSIHFPFIKEGFEEVEEELFEKTLAVLKSKNVDVIYTYIRDDWNPDSFLEKHEFSVGELLQFDAEFSIEKLIPNNYERPSSLCAFEYKKHKEKIRDAFNQLNIGVDPGPMLERWIKDPTFVMGVVFLMKEKIMAMGRMNRFPRVENSCGVRIYTFGKNNQDIRKSLFEDLLVQALKNEFTYMFLSIPAKGISDCEIKGYDINFVPFRRYEKEI